MASMAEITMKVQLMKIIRNIPGIQATDERVPKHLRRFFRILEKEDGAIEYKDGWYVKETK